MYCFEQLDFVHWGLLGICFLVFEFLEVLQWYYITFNLLKKHKLTKTYSPLDLMMKLTEIKKIKINDRWYLSETTQNTNDLLEKLKIDIPIP